MSGTVVLQDPQSGSMVYLRVAELKQRCRVCRSPLHGEWAAATDSTGWACLSHLGDVLLALPMCQEFVQRAEARKAAEGWSPGDLVTVTRPLLAALGLRPER